MIRKLLESAAVVFLVVSILIALLADESLYFGLGDYYSAAFMGCVLLYPLVAAVIVWDHNTSRTLKYCSAGFGFAIIATLVGVAGRSTFSETSPEALADGSLVLLYILVFVSSVTSVVGRFFVSAWRILRFLPKHPTSITPFQSN